MQTIVYFVIVSAAFDLITVFKPSTLPYMNKAVVVFKPED